MPATTSPHGIQYPVAADLIRDSSVLAKLADDMRALALTTNSAITTAVGGAGWYRGLLTADTDLGTIEDGAWWVNSIGDATALGLPEAATGLVEQVQATASGVRVFIPASGTGRVWVSRKTSTGWQPWGTTDFMKDPLTSTTDFDTVTASGAYPVPYSTNPNGPGAVGLLIVGDAGNPTLGIITQMVVTESQGIVSRSVRNGVWRGWSSGTGQGLPIAPAGARDAADVSGNTLYQLPYVTSLAGRPTDAAGNLLSLNAGHPSIEFEQQLFLGADGAGAYYRTGRDKNFQAWAEVGVPDGAMDKGAGYREALVSAFRARRGGTIGTAGKGVVALRFDHHLAQFQEKVLPLLVERGLPWAQAINPANLGTGNDTMTYAQIEAMCVENGGEVWNHGRNHGDAPGINAGRREIVQSLAELRAGLPALAIEGFMPPGVADGGYLGASPFRTPEQWATPLGRMILANHAAVSGYMGGWYRTLDGQIDVGMGHRTMDNSQLYHWQASIDAAAALGVGVTFMVHANYIDQSGYISLATLTSALDRIAQARDEGRIEVLSPSALLLADVGSSHRRNLLRTGADVTGGWSETVDLAQPDQRGAVHEVVATLDGTGDATLTVTEGTRLALSRTVALPGSARIAFTIPADATSFTVALTGAGSGSVQLQAT